MSSREKEDRLVSEGDVELYRRARERWESPEPPEAVAVAVLSRFVELEHLAAATAGAAARRARDPEVRRALEAVADGQRALVPELGQAVRDFGGAPPEPEESREELPGGPEAVAFAQSDEQVLRVVLEDLQELERRYREASADERTPEEARRRLLRLAEVQGRARRELGAGS